MWSDPLSPEYALFGFEPLSIAAGILVVFVLTMASAIFFHRRGQRGVPLLGMTLAASFPLVVVVLMLRAVVAFFLVLVEGTLDGPMLPTLSFGIDVVIITTLVGAVYYLMSRPLRGGTGKNG